jgi:hypothetical protein
MSQQVQSTFQHLVNTSSDINEHLPTLSKYASECESVFETGVRGCVSSWAFAHGLLLNNSSTKTLFMNDIEECDVGKLLQYTRDLPIVINYKWIDNLKLNFTQSYDLTFIDTWHVYGQLKRELAKFAPITNKYIIMHDTTVDEWLGESIRDNHDVNKQSQWSGFPVEEINRGLWPAIEEFLVANPNWVLHERFTNNNGLTVLRRTD